MKQLLTAAIALTFAAGVSGVALAQTNGDHNQTPINLTNTPPESSATLANGKMAGPPATAQNVSKNTIREAQQQLKAQGLYKGEINGVNGPPTKAALARYQQKHGLPRTATLDQPTLNRLLGAPSNMTAGFGSSASPNAAAAENGAGGSITPNQNPAANGKGSASAPIPTTSGFGSSAAPAYKNGNYGPITPRANEQGPSDDNDAGANATK